MDFPQRALNGAVLGLKRLGAAALAGMMFITVFDVITRKLGIPVFGLVEIVSLLATLVLACSMPVTHQEDGHVGVDLLLRRMKSRPRLLLEATTALLGFLLFGIITWQMYVYGLDLAKSGEVSMSLQIPYFYLVYAVATAFGLLALVILAEFFHKCAKAGA